MKMTSFSGPCFVGVLAGALLFAPCVSGQESILPLLRVAVAKQAQQQDGSAISVLREYVRNRKLLEGSDDNQARRALAGELRTGQAELIKRGVSQSEAKDIGEGLLLSLSSKRKLGLSRFTLETLLAYVQEPDWNGSNFSSRFRVEKLNDSPLYTNIMYCPRSTTLMAVNLASSLNDVVLCDVLVVEDPKEADSNDTLAKACQFAGGAVTLANKGREQCEDWLGYAVSQMRDARAISEKRNEFAEISLRVVFTGRGKAGDARPTWLISIGRP